MPRRLIACVIVLAVAGLLAPTRAAAIPIGSFGWDDTCGSFDPLVGACFSVVNLSEFTLSTPLTFGNVLIHLQTGGGEVTLSLGDVVSSAVTTTDLRDFTITAATLTFDVGLPGILTLLDEAAAPIASLFDLVPVQSEDLGGIANIRTATIDFTPGAAVPEPGTLMLLIGGLAMLAVRGRRRARRHSIVLG
jgi:hypothetical protein